MSIEIKISLNEGIYLKDPQDSLLGRNIIKYSILLIEEVGFEGFNFKKLAQEIGSTEASIYRYFENKHSLLIYLVSWYWEWVAFRIKMKTINIDAPKKRLEIIIHVIVSASLDDPSTDFVDEDKLHNVVIAEGTKAYRTKEVDQKNGKGIFKHYKQLISMVAGVILEINPKFEYPYALASNLFEMSNNHIYFAKHLPKLTDVDFEKDIHAEVEKILNHFAAKLLDYKI